jgi:hypothetical protein
MARVISDDALNEIIEQEGKMFMVVHVSTKMAGAMAREILAARRLLEEFGPLLAELSVDDLKLHILKQDYELARGKL